MILRSVISNFNTFIWANWPEARFGICFF